MIEHITTKNGVDYVHTAPNDLAATIPIHHLFINRNHILAGGIRPHYYCLPIPKREEHRIALRAAATSGDSRFFLGTDSAPHLDTLKETACGCAGCFTATNTMPLLAQVFDEEHALNHLEGFTSRHGAKFYGLSLNKATITLNKGKKPVYFPSSLNTPEGDVTIFDPNQAIFWQVTDR